MQMKLTGVSAIFEPFDWVYNKTNFPKFKDDGKATCTISDMSANVTFDMVKTADLGMKIDNMKVNILIGVLEVEVEEAGEGSNAKKWIYNKILSLFSGQIREVVQVRVLSYLYSRYAQASRTRY